MLLARIDQAAELGNIDSWLAAMKQFDVQTQNTAIWMDGLLLKSMAVAYVPVVGGAADDAAARGDLF